MGLAAVMPVRHRHMGLAAGLAAVMPGYNKKKKNVTAVVRHRHHLIPGVLMALPQNGAKKTYWICVMSSIVLPTSFVLTVKVPSLVQVHAQCAKLVRRRLRLVMGLAAVMPVRHRHMGLAAGLAAVMPGYNKKKTLRQWCVTGII